MRKVFFLIQWTKLYKPDIFTIDKAWCCNSVSAVLLFKKAVNEKKYFLGLSIKKITPLTKLVYISNIAATNIWELWGMSFIIIIVSRIN